MNAIALYRLGHWCHDRRIPLVPRLVRILLFLVYNSVIPVTAQIGEGTTFGARILGPIRVGRGSAVGANAVVLEDVPAGCAVTGVPARIVRSNIDIRDYWA